MRSLIIRFFILLGLFFPELASAVTPMVAAGEYYTVALKSDGTVMTWGDNAFGQLGDGTTTQRLSPVAVPGLLGVVAVRATYHTVALKSDGTVITWGISNFGQLGDGTTTDRWSPAAVPGLTGVVAVSAGERHTVALKSDGTVMAWGSNSFGQLADGTTTQRNSPVAVPGLTGVVAVAAGYFHTVALKSDGTVVAWGYNAFCQLGDGTTTQRFSPVAVPGLTGVVAVAAGERHTVALKSDGTVVAWGYNADGEQGDGTTTQRCSPVGVPGITGVVAVAVGARDTLALKSEGTVMTWGSNYYGELGDGTTADRWSPAGVPGLTGVVAVAAGYQHTVALKSDGTLVAWGYNADGELGDGTKTQSNRPVAVVGGLNLGVAIPNTTSLSPTFLTFAAQNVGSISAAQTLSLTNTGSSVLNITSIISSGNYARTTTCGNTLAAGANCTISVTFTPTATGARSGSLTIASNFASSLYTVGLSGTGVSVPDAPVIGIATSGNTQATVSFTAPASNGGSAIIGYTVTSTPSGFTATGAASPITVTGLINGTAYTFTVKATNALGDGPISNASNSVIPKANQTIGAISFSPTTLIVGGITTASATATSDLAVSFSSATPSVCTVSGNTVTGVTAGTCTIAANQAGNTLYNAATQVSQSISIGKASQTVSFGTAPTITVGGTGVVSATATSGLAVSFSSTTPSVCTISGNTVTGFAIGICTIAANQAGNANYNAATQVTLTIAIKASQTVSFGTAPTITVHGTGVVSATATSGLAVSFNSATPSVCTVNGSIVTGVTAGTCTIAANQAGNANYNAATQVSQSITIGLDIARYLPHAAGNQWSYVNNNQATMTNTFGGPVTLPSGVVAIPWTRVDNVTCVVSCVTYNTFDASGWLHYQEYMSSVYISGYGNTSVTAVYAPALSFAPAAVTVGNTYTSTGAVTITYTNVTTAALHYSANTQVVGFETVTNNAGTQAWLALKVITSITLSGTVNGHFITTSEVNTYWMVDGLGIVKAIMPNASGVMETWKLTSMTIVPTNELTNSEADCLMNWGEDGYPMLLSPGRPPSQTASPYYFRYYTGTNSYLGISSDDNHLYYLSATNGLADLGLAATWSSQAGCR